MTVIPEIEMPGHGSASNCRLS
ncbi:hypothetical protein ACQ9BO_24720 [Flavobacterium sp. P21]